MYWLLCKHFVIMEVGTQEIHLRQHEQAIALVIIIVCSSLDSVNMKMFDSSLLFTF